MNDTWRGERRLLSMQVERYKRELEKATAGEQRA